MSATSTPRDPAALGVQFDLLLDATRDIAVLSVSPEGFVTSWNPGAERIKGYTDHEILGRHYSVFYPPEELQSGRVEDDLRAAERAGAGSVESEGWRLRKDGSRFWANVVTTAIYDEDDGKLAGFGKVIRDMTERKRFVDELQEARDISDRASQAKDSFLANMSHELRTPLNAVIGFSQVLLLDDLTADQREAVDHIGAAGHHLLGLIDEILDMSRLTSGQLGIDIAPVNVATAVDEALNLLARVAERGALVVTAEDDGTHVAADPRRLRQVVLNLLSNAVKYNLPGGDVQVSWGPGETGRVRLRVTDTGQGIAPEQLDRLFVPFDRLGADSTEIEGTGLGLTLSKALVEAMDGTIEVESVLGEGTTFTVDLPLTMPVAVSAETDRTAEWGTAHPEAPLRVLYIENNLSSFQLVQHVLRSRPNIEVIPAMQGRAGVGLARTMDPHLVLLDLNLPDLPGEEVLERLREDPVMADLPVAILSADDDPGRIAVLEGMGVTAYLTKPLDVAALLDLMDHCPRPVAVS